MHLIKRGLKMAGLELDGDRSHLVDDAVVSPCVQRC